MKSPRPLYLDCAAPLHRRPRVGWALAVVGAALAVALGASFATRLEERSALESALNRSQARAPRAGANQSRGQEEQTAIARGLSVPWSQLLGELEAAAHDSGTTIAVLELEPDPAKHLLHITAEAASLTAVLAYLERLQQSRVLRYPMLESHERRKDDPEHPVRVKLTAEWRA